ncbi:Type II secretion system (T2SS), protein F [Candidatus Gugararchaeum adminiculabundum]|nr:Type II secretion system (T2SS), protein F [Candidatus Gugararchaeum adminiculabundum]
MGLFKRFLKILGRILPRGMRDSFAKTAVYAGIEEDVDILVGKRLFTSCIISFLLMLVPLVIVALRIDLFGFGTGKAGMVAGALVALGVFIFTNLFLMSVYYFSMYYAAEDRTQRVEKVLPDFLMLVAANMRAGMTPFNAFRASSRKEFGPLEREIQIATTKSLGTESFESALSHLTTTVNSNILQKTVALFVKGARSGGHMAKLLESSAQSVREIQELKNELVGSTRTYGIFLLFIVAVGIPVLLAISGQFLLIYSDVNAQTTNTKIPEQIGLGMVSGGGTPLSPVLVQQTSYFIMIITAFLVSLLVGAIAEGKMQHGVKYFVPIALCAVILFFGARIVISNFLAFS